MKKLLTLSLLFLVFISCFGNAEVFRGSGQTPTLEKTDTIQMVEEEIIMIPRRGNYPVDTSCRNLLIYQPQFADQCDWAKLRECDWDELLARWAQFAKMKRQKGI